MTQTRRRGPARGPDTANTDSDSVTVALDLRHGRAVAYPPLRGRTLWLVVCRQCPWCASGHAHRSGLTARLLSGRVTKLCPVWGKPYVVAPVRRGREAIRPVGWSA